MAPGRVINLNPPTEPSLLKNVPVVDLGVQGQVLPLALPREAWNCLPLCSPTLIIPFLALPAPFPSSQSHRADQSQFFPGRNHILFPASLLEWNRRGWLSDGDVAGWFEGGAARLFLLMASGVLGSISGSPLLYVIH